MNQINILKSLIATVLLVLLSCSLPVNAQQIDPETPNSEAIIQKQTRSLIEQSFPVGLKQVGYDFFQNFQASGVGKYDNDYLLSIGEKLNIYCWGDSVNVMALSGSNLISPLVEAQVDTKGDLFLPGIGVVKAEGRSISEVEKSFQDLANSKFKSLKIKATVANSSEFAIFVYGYVNKPGKITLSNNSTVIEALAAAGGVNKNGSLRNITYRSGKKTTSVDLYEIIFNGKESDVKIKPNDTIFVNNIGGVAALKNGVKIPGIYELKEGESIQEAITFAGGILPSTNNKSLNIKSFNKEKGQRFSRDISTDMFTSTILANGDIVEFSSLFGKADNFVKLEGHVKHPSIFEYKEGMKLSDILKNKNELQDESLLHQAVIKRISPVDKQLKTIPVSLEEYFDGGNNPYLEPQDTITIYKSTSSSFIDVYGCINKPKSIPYNKKLTLKDILTDIQFISAVNNISNKKEIVNVNNEKTDKAQAEKTLPPLTLNNMIIPASKVAVEITNTNNPTKLETYYLLDILVKGDWTKSIKIEPNDKVLFRTLRDDEVLKTVKISGYVNNPGVYSFIQGKKLTDMIELAGGLKEDANLKGIVFKRESLAANLQKTSLKKDKKDMELIQGQMIQDKNLTMEEAQSQKLLIDSINSDKTNSLRDFDGRIVLNIKKNDLEKLPKSENIIIEDGDEIFIPKMANYVSVMGEVYNEASFIYEPKKRASDYIDLVGGYTPNAKKNKIYKVSSNGKAYKLKKLSAKIEPGDTIIVPRKTRGNDWLTTLAKSMQVIVSTLTSVFIVTELN